MHLRHSLAPLLLLSIVSCREPPREVRPGTIELACGESWSQHVGPVEIWLPPTHEVIGVADLTEPGWEQLLDWLRQEASSEVTFECPDGVLAPSGWSDETATGDGTTCLASYQGTLSGACACGDPVEQCDNGLDDDDDGRTDCEDSDCATMPHCLPPPWRCSGGDACELDGRILGDGDPACADPRKLQVCVLDPWCCTYEWDLTCAARADELGLCADEDAGVDAGPDAEPDAMEPDAGVDAMEPPPDAMEPPPVDAMEPPPDAWMSPIDAGWMPDAFLDNPFA